MRIFIDTNIFLDLILKRERFKEAVILLNSCEQKLFEGYVADITLLNIDYVASKQVKDIKDFLGLVNTIFDVTGGTNKMFDEALSIKNIDLVDNLQYISAKKLMCDVIVTNDKTFYSEEIVTFTSNAFVDKYL